VAACADNPTGPQFDQAQASVSSSQAGGPIILMGIDAEDGGAGGHGPITVYRNVVESLLAAVNNGGTGILVIGAGKSGTDHVTAFWNALSGVSPAISVTYVNSAAGISAQSFAGFALIAVSSSIQDTPSGGLTEAENQALTGRQADVAAHVNAGGGLLGFSAGGLSTPYGYLAGVGSFTFNFPSQYSGITPTQAGLDVGITTQLNVCCWHDEYITFPSFLEVLATNNATGNPAAIGGVQVVIPPSETTGCSAGFWGNNGLRQELWPSPYLPGHAVSSVFSGATGYLGSASLLDAVTGYKDAPKRRSTLEGAMEILLRQAVAALLNEARSSASFPATSVGDLQDEVNAALASGNRQTILALAGKLEAWNNNFQLDANGNIVRDEFGNRVLTGACPPATD
jgi:hypothetical protein